jgi:3-oxoacyl-[acyl-carrier protein] reductase
MAPVDTLQLRLADPEVSPIGGAEEFASDAFAGKVVIVTGAGQGLGRVYAKRFASLGARVVVADIVGENSEEVCREIVSAGGRAIATATDVGAESSVGAMVDSALAEFGKVDILINNAAIATALLRTPFTELTLDEWNEVFRVNATGAFLCARAVSPHMKKQRWGRIINVSSTTVVMGRVNFLHYVSSKSAVIGMTRAMARELGPFGITVNVLLPGLTPHEVTNPGWTSEGIGMIKAMQCIPRVEQPDDLSGMVLFLASETSRFLTGQSIAVDGGAVHV